MGDHPSWQLPGPWAGSLVAGPVRLAPDGVWRAAASPRSLVGSYPTVSPLPVGGSGDPPKAVCFLFHFPSAFAPWLAPASCPAVSGLSSSLAEARTAVTRPAVPNSSSGLVGERGLRSRAAPPHSGQKTTPARACITNSPQTRHSSEAPRRSAASSWSSVRANGEQVAGAQSSRKTPTTFPRIWT